MGRKITSLRGRDDEGKCSQGEGETRFLLESLLFLMLLITKLHFAKSQKSLIKISVSVNPHVIVKVFLACEGSSRIVFHSNKKSFSLFIWYPFVKAQQPADIIYCFSIQALIKVNYSTPKSSLYLLLITFSLSPSHPSHSSFSFTNAQICTDKHIF